MYYLSSLFLDFKLKAYCLLDALYYLYRQNIECLFKTKIKILYSYNHSF